jgi:hypothetical protein
MIDKDEFIKLVESSISYSVQGFPYLTIEDTNLICPFCEKELTMKGRELKCTCEDSIEFVKKYISLHSEMEKIKNSIIFMENMIKNNSLGFFKKYFSNVILPELKNEFNKNTNEILNL